MPNIEKLKDVIKAKGYTFSEIASAAGMNISTLYRKINLSGDSFTIKEARLISTFLKLTYDEVNEIFFNISVA